MGFDVRNSLIPTIFILLTYSNPAVSERLQIPQAWGIKNEGQSFWMEGSDYTQTEIQGTRGEDIEWADPQDAFKDRTPVAIPVAVIDTGIDLNHPLLGDRILLPKGVELNFTRPGTVPQDTRGHGTHVAGVIAQVSEHAKIIPIKYSDNGANTPIITLGETPNSSSFADHRTIRRVVQSIQTAIVSGAKVISLSLGWPRGLESPALGDVLDLAKKSGVLVIAAAGNDATLADVAPCSYASVICVGAYRPDGKTAGFSNFGPSVDVYAPGFGIVSTWPTHRKPVRWFEGAGLERLSGTSMAAPFVSGIAAELLAYGVPPLEVRARILQNTRSGNKVSLKRAMIDPLRPEWELSEKLIQDVDVVPGKDFGAREIFLESSLPPLRPKEYRFQVEFGDGEKPVYSHQGWVIADNNRWKITINIPEIEMRSHQELPLKITFFEADQKSYSRTGVLRGWNRRDLKRDPTPSGLSAITDALPILALNGHGVVGRLHVVQDGATERWRVFKNAMDLDPQTEIRSPIPASSLLSVFFDGDDLLLVRSISEGNRPFTTIHRWDAIRREFTEELRSPSTRSGLNPSMKWVRHQSRTTPVWIGLLDVPLNQRDELKSWRLSDRQYQEVIAQKMRVVTNSDQGTRVWIQDQFEVAVALFPQTEVLIRQGQIQVLVLRQTKQRQEFFIVTLEFQENQLKEVTRKLMASPLGRITPPMDSQIPVLGIGPEAQRSHVMALPGAVGRVTLLRFDPELNQVQGIGVKNPDGPESIVGVCGMWISGAESWVCYQTHSEVKIQRVSDGKTLARNSRRSSFLPDFAALARYSLFFKDQTTPALYWGESATTRHSASVLVFDPNKNILSEPATLRVRAQSDCHTLPTPYRQKSHYFWVADCGNGNLDVVRLSE